MQINPDRLDESLQLILVQSISYSEFRKWLNMWLYELHTSLSPNQSAINGAELTAIRVGDTKYETAICKFQNAQNVFKSQHSFR